MDEQTKAKGISLEDLQISVQDVLNKGLGNIGTCSTAASTAAKEVTLGTTFDLVSGATILVTFTNGISVAGATLAVTHTPIGGSQTTETEKPIFYRGAALAANMVKAGAQLILRYDGTNFNVIGDLDTDTDTVTDVTFDRNTNTLKQTKGGVQSDVVQIVTSGFSLTHDNATGADKFTAIGTATFTHDDTTGADKFTF